MIVHLNTNIISGIYNCENCDLNFTVKDEGLLKVTGKVNISEAVLDRDVVTSGH